MAAGALPLWTPDLYTGFPILAAVETGSLYPTNLLLFGILDPYAAVAWAQLLPLFLAGLGTFLLAREYALPSAAALLAAGAFSLSGFFVSHLRQLNMVDAAAWIPFVLLGCERIARGRGAATPALAVVWTLQILAGHPQISYFTALVAGVFLVARWRQIDRERPRGSAPWPLRLARDPAPWRFAAALGVGSLVAAPALAPGIELARLSHRQGGFSFADASAYPASPRSIWSFFLPYVNGDPGRDTWHLSGVFWEQYGYLGLAPALLAIGAAVVAWRNARVRLFAAIVVVSWLLVLGPNTFVFWLAHQWVPGMAYFRFPTRFLVFVDLGLALLAGFGLAALLAAIRSDARRSAIAAAIVAVTAVDLWTNQMRQVPEVEWARWRSPIGAVEHLKAERARSSGPWRYFSLDSAFVHAMTFHAARGWSGDLEPYVRLRAMLQPSFNLLHGLESPDGYVNLAPRYYEAVWGSDKEPGLVRPSAEVRDGTWRLRPEVARLLRLFNVRWVISALRVESPDLGPPLVLPEAVAIHEVRDPLPRAFVVGEAAVAQSDAEALGRLRAPDFDPAREAILHSPADVPPGIAPGESSVRIVGRGPRSLALEATLERPGLLVVSEGYYPGWAATVDGREAPLLRANMMMRAVFLDAGSHRVEFDYRPRALWIGLALSLAGLAGLAVWSRHVLQKPV